MIGFLICKLILAMCLSWTIAGPCPMSCSCTEHLVSCQNKNLTEIPSNITEGITTLQLSFNRITTVTNNGALNLLRLRTLSLYNNRITTIEPDAFSQLGSLKKLQLQHNDISDISNRTFTGLTELTVLEIDFNRITFLPSGIFDSLINLKTLEMQNNRLNDISCEILRGLTNLLKLDVSDNPLSHVPLCIPSIVTSFRANNITAIINPELLQNLPNTVILELSMNNLTDIPIKILESMPLLEQFKAEFNSVTSITANAFKSNVNLKELYLGYNNLKYIVVNAFDGLQNLLYLSLRQNNLHTLPEGAFPSFSSQISIDFSDNPWFCDCNLRWTKNAMNLNALEIKQFNPICKEPLLNQNKSLLIVESEHLACSPVIGSTQTEFQIMKIAVYTFVELTCNVSGDPYPTINWTTPEDHRLIPVKSPIDASLLVIQSNGSLVISNVTVKDSGNYTCTATNAGGIVHIRYSLNVVNNKTIHIEATPKTLENQHEMTTAHLVVGKQNNKSTPIFLFIAPTVVCICLMLIIIGYLVYKKRMKNRERQLKTTADIISNVDTYDEINMANLPNQKERNCNSSHVNRQSRQTGEESPTNDYEQRISRNSLQHDIDVNHMYCIPPNDDQTAKIRTIGKDEVIHDIQSVETIGIADTSGDDSEIHNTYFIPPKVGKDPQEHYSNCVTTNTRDEHTYYSPPKESKHPQAYSNPRYERSISADTTRRTFEDADSNKSNNSTSHVCISRNIRQNGGTTTGQNDSMYERSIADDKLRNDSDTNQSYNSTRGRSDEGSINRHTYDSPNIEHQYQSIPSSQKAVPLPDRIDMIIQTTCIDCPENIMESENLSFENSPEYDQIPDLDQGS